MCLLRTWGVQVECFWVSFYQLLRNVSYWDRCGYREVTVRKISQCSQDLWLSLQGPLARSPEVGNPATASPSVPAQTSQSVQPKNIFWGPTEVRGMGEAGNALRGVHVCSLWTWQGGGLPAKFRSSTSLPEGLLPPATFKNGYFYDCFKSPALRTLLKTRSWHAFFKTPNLAPNLPALTLTI